MGSPGAPGASGFPGGPTGSGGPGFPGGPQAGKPRWGQPTKGFPPAPPGHIRVRGTTTMVPIDTTKLAPLGLRVLARLIDVVAVFLLCLVVNGYFYLQFAEEIGPNINDILLGQETLSAEASRLNWIIFVLTIGLWFAYEVPATANSGQTLGKRIVGIRVIRVVDDKSLTFGQSIRRWLILMLPSPAVSFLCGLPLQLADLLWCLWDRPARQCLHDKVVTSIVVRSAAVPVGPASEAQKPN
jgi:uncharacterized RDD family membrane protein YckC